MTARAYEDKDYGDWVFSDGQKRAFHEVFSLFEYSHDDRTD